MDVPELTRDEMETLLERLHEASFGWALSCTQWNDADAEDVLQTTYMKVVSGRARFGGRSAFRTWLFGVILQTAREHERRARSHRERAERSRLLLEALAELADRQREVLHLVFYKDLTIREAAEVMDVSVGSARVHYERGKKRLRSLLSESDVGGGAE